MITVTTTMTRPNTDSQWFMNADPALASIIASSKIELGSTILNTSTTTSFDGLTLTGVLEFNNHDAYYAWTEKLRTADPLFLAKRNDYIVNNGHTLKIEESLDNGPAIVEKLI